MEEKIDLQIIREYLKSKDKETVSLGLELFISDYQDLYNDIRNRYSDKRLFDTVIYHLLHGIIDRKFLRFNYSVFIQTSIIFYIDSYIYEQFNNTFVKYEKV